MFTGSSFAPAQADENIPVARWGTLPRRHIPVPIRRVFGSGASAMDRVRLMAIPDPVFGASRTPALSGLVGNNDKAVAHAPHRASVRAVRREPDTQSRAFVDGPLQCIAVLVNCGQAIDIPVAVGSGYRPTAFYS